MKFIVKRVDDKKCKRQSHELHLTLEDDGVTFLTFETYGCTPKEATDEMEERLERFSSYLQRYVKSREIWKGVGE